MNHSSVGAGRNIPLETTVKRRELRNLIQVVSESRPNERSANRYGLSVALAGWNDEIQPGAAGIQRLEMFRNIPAGTASQTEDEDRVRRPRFSTAGHFSGTSPEPITFSNTAPSLQYAGAASPRRPFPETFGFFVSTAVPWKCASLNRPSGIREDAATLTAYFRTR